MDDAKLRDISMEEFIHLYVERFHKPNTSRNLLASLAKTALSNLISLPFGIISVSTSRSLSKDEMKKKISDLLYSNYGVLAKAIDINPDDLISLAQTFYDRCETDFKIQILSLALSDEAGYRDFCSDVVIKIRKSAA